MRKQVALLGLLALFLFALGIASGQESEVVLPPGDSTLICWDGTYPEIIETAMGIPQATCPLEPTPTPTEVPPTPTVTPFPTDTPVPPTPLPPGESFVIDHNSIALFDSIPQEYLDAAENMGMMFHNRSVGDNISGGLTCLEYPWAEAPHGCKRGIPEGEEFDGPYLRTNWAYEIEGGSYWYETMRHFVEVSVPQYLDSADVFMHLFNYLNTLEIHAAINDQWSGWFYDREDPRFYDVYDYEDFIAQHPDKTFVFATSSLARISGPVSTEFNDTMRQYALDNNKILFDLADIESHDIDGNLCTDGAGNPIICSDYTSETVGGHLGSMATGKIRVAKAMWVMMAMINGWNG